MRHKVQQITGQGNKQNERVSGAPGPSPATARHLAGDRCRRLHRLQSAGNPARLDQRVVGLDNFSTGHQHNLDEVEGRVSAEPGSGSVSSGAISATWKPAVKPAPVSDYVLHQAALGSVPRSIEDPITTNENNISGFLNMLVAARDAKVRRMVYAASSSTYGDHPGLPKVEDRIGNPLSPYAVTKLVNELYAECFCPHLRLQNHRPALFQHFRPAPGPGRRLCRGHPQMVCRSAQGRAGLHQRRRRNQPRFLLHRQLRPGQHHGGHRR